MKTCPGRYPATESAKGRSSGDPEEPAFESDRRRVHLAQRVRNRQKSSGQQAKNVRSPNLRRESSKIQMPGKQGELLSKGPSCSPEIRAGHTRSFLLSQEETLWHPKWQINRKPRGPNHFLRGMQFCRSKRGEEAKRGPFACQSLSGYFWVQKLSTISL
jgi:hypothetical protein